MRYFSRPRARVQDGDGWSLNPGSPYLTIEPRADERPPYIEVPEHEAAATGLLDANGDPIMRAPNEMGFGRGDW